MTVRSNNAQLQAIFDRRVEEEVRSKEFPYEPLRPARRDWARYNAAQENEFPEVIGLIGTFVGKASEAFRPPPRYDAMGRKGALLDARRREARPRAAVRRQVQSRLHRASHDVQAARSSGYAGCSTPPTRR